MQKWSRIHDYAYQYQQWVYKMYSEMGPAYPCTYWNQDLPNSVYDGEVLDNAFYQQFDNLSGMRWRKILFLPVFHIEQISVQQNADEQGMTKKEQTVSFVIPSEYGFNPMPHDFIKFEQHVLQPDSQGYYPTYEISNFEKATNTQITHWKAQAKVSHATTKQLDRSLSAVDVFLDYNKRIYKSEKAAFMFRLLEKNQNLSTINDYYKSNPNLYFMDK